MTQFINQDALREIVPYSEAMPGVRLSDIVRETRQGGRVVYEFIGADDFGSEWYERTRFEVEAGRAAVPLVYEPIYDIIVDSNLPETLKLQTLGPGGFVFEEVFEGGEVKFASVASSEASVSQRQFAVGLEYTKKLVMFNQLWSVARMERWAGEAHNALLNHLHLYPIINYTYTAANQTAAVTSGSTTTEDWFLTLEAAIVNSMEDTTNPRPGPYALLSNPAQMFMVQRMLSRETQQEFKLDSTASDLVQTAIGYRGWTGTRGAKTTTYAGVTSGKSYLVDLSHKDQDFASYVKQSLEQAQGNADVSRFILEQVIWDIWLGVYANPLRAVEEITWPS